MAEYTLDCKYYKKVFPSVNALVEDVMVSGMDPNYEILKNGEKTGEIVFDLIVF